jgi:hypothetical protein
MPVKFTTASSPYEILAGLLCGFQSIYHSAERSYPYHYLTGDKTHYRTFSFGTGFEQSNPWRVLNHLTGSSVLTGTDPNCSARLYREVLPLPCTRPALCRPCIQSRSRTSA